MKDLYKAIDALNDILKEAPTTFKTDTPVKTGTPIKSTPAAKTPGAAAYNNPADMFKAITTPGRQGVSDPAQSAKNIAAAQPKPTPRPAAVSPTPNTGRQDGPAALKPAAVAPKPAATPMPAGGPRRANPINPQAMAATKAAASVVNAPKPAAPAPRAKVKATAANTKDFDKTMALQKKLQAQGYDIKADGIMGKNTRAAMAKAATPKTAKSSTATPKATPTDAGEFATATPKATATPREFTPIAGAGDRKPGATSQDIRVNKSNNAVRRDFKKVKDAGSGILDKIGAGISSIFKPSDRSVIGKRGRNVARSAAPAAPAGPNAAGSNFATAADGSISSTDNPRQPGDATRTTRTASAPVARDSGPERGTVPGQGAGERTVSVGGQQVTGADADRAISRVNQAGDNARLRMGAARAGLSVADYQAQQNRLNKQAGDRMMKTAKASDAGVF